MPQRFVVLQSYQEPRSTTNPYIVMLGQSLAALPDVDVLTFTWKRALTTRYDVFHMHWPEIRVGGRTAFRRLAQQMMFGLLMARLSVSRTPIVRTAHNLRLPQGISRREAFLLKIADRRTSLRILLNSATTVVPGQAYVTIPHGHYIDWFQPYPALSPKRGRIAYFGLIRHYKNVEGLIRAFRGRQEGSGLQLLVAGKPSNGELGQRLLDAAGNDGDIELNLQFLTDEELVHAVTGAALVALPYREMHNSGGALTALSLGRPVLVPTNEVNTLLSEEVGAGWVFCYDGELTAAHLACAMAELATYPADRPGPDLSDRGWNQVGAQHLAAYRRAVAIVRIRRNRPLKKQRVTGG